MLRGKAPLTVVRLADGRRANVHAGSFAPEDVDVADAERLVKGGFLEEVAPTPVVEAAEPEPEAEPEPVAEEGAEPEAEPSPEPVAVEPKAPGKSASKAEWVAYAIDEARGADKLDVEVAEAMTRDQLAEAVGA